MIKTVFFGLMMTLLVIRSANCADVAYGLVLMTRLSGEKEISHRSALDLQTVQQGTVAIGLLNSAGRPIDLSSTEGESMAAEDAIKIESIKWYQLTPSSMHDSGFARKELILARDRLEISFNELVNMIGLAHSTGTFRLQVSVTLQENMGGSLVLESPGGVHALRLSFRLDDTYLGWLTSYFNVPYRYGSSQPEVRNYIYSDCADFVVAGITV